MRDLVVDDRCSQESPSQAGYGAGVGNQAGLRRRRHCGGKVFKVRSSFLSCISHCAFHHGDTGVGRVGGNRESGCILHTVSAGRTQSIKPSRNPTSLRRHCYIAAAFEPCEQKL